MNTRKPARILAMEMANRSHCAVQVGAVFEDGHGIFAWGWNNAGQHGRGCHAEVHAVLRANKRRLRGAKVTVYGKYKRNDNPVLSEPCDGCTLILKRFGVKVAEYYSKTAWKHKSL